ncbi:uncharacterized protein LOC133917566 [Phragmites australis]|uniref:uncharacterized protein LOC133917566 n=1 Tax=Phragmites australis TaxID=29695 RepID=UPI002D79A33A|nr:uncharacterized protein LOC133917566 [Phragmites australis]
MRKEIIIRMHAKSEKCRAKAMKVAAAVSGVESVTLAGGDKSLLLVIADGVDSNKLTKKLKKKVGNAEIVELRTLDTFVTALPLPRAAAGAPGSKGMAQMAMLAQSPYNHHQWQYSYAAAPSPYAYNYYHPSPMGGAVERGYGYGTGISSYSRAVARSHPANYSPLVEKHDYQPMDHSSSSMRSKEVARRESDTNSCAIL